MGKLLQVTGSSEEKDCEPISYCLTETERTRELQRREESRRQRVAKRGPGYQSPDLHVFFLQFDRSKRVVRHGTVVMKEHESIKDVLSEWMKGK